MSDNEYRVFGPPGTGKTTFLSTQVRKWSAERGSDQLMLASFTRTAAAEMAGRDLPLRREQIGTLHSFAYRSLGLHRGQVAESHIADFNAEHPAYRLSGGNNDPEDVSMSVGGNEGDQLMMQAQALRGQQTDVAWWPARVRWFHDAWNTWCSSNDLIDFTGMIELALQEVPAAPGNPSIGLFDEAQDFTPLELALVRHWGERMDTVLIAGDDDQCIYAFKGASPDVFLDPPLPDSQKKVLSQSYRVPLAVHRVAQSWVEQLRRREAKEYAPRTENGEPVQGCVRILSAGAHMPEPLIDDVCAQAEAGRTVMILATCGYVLQPIVRRLRERAVPFHNPYRTKRGDWNPLAPGTAQRKMPVDRLLAYLRPDTDTWGDQARMWTWGEMQAWLDALRSDGLLKRGAKTWLKGQTANAVADYADACARLWADETSDAVHGLEQGDLDTFRQLLLAKRAAPYEFPLAVARTHGPQTLRKAPSVVVGTIHSVKGGQADVVYVLPDMSAQGMAQWMDEYGRGERDNVIRQFYVGMTRAREELVVCEGRMRSVPLDTWVRTKSA